MDYLEILSGEKAVSHIGQPRFAQGGLPALMTLQSKREMTRKKKNLLGR